METERRLRLVEFALWVGVVSTLVTGATLVAGYVVGGTLVAAKYALFLVATLLFGLGSFGIQPTPPHKERRRFSLEGSRQNRLEARIQKLPPLRGDRLPFDRRISRGVKVFVTSLVVFAVVVVMEFGLGIRV